MCLYFPYYKKKGMAENKLDCKMFTESSNDRGLSQTWEKVHLGHPADKGTSNHSVFSAPTLSILRFLSPKVLPLPSKLAPSTPQNPTPSTFYHLHEKAGLLKYRTLNKLPPCSQAGRSPSPGLCCPSTPNYQN